MIFNFIRLFTFRKQLLLLQQRNARVGINLDTDTLQRVTIKNVGWYTVTVAYDDLDLDDDMPFDLNDDEEWISFKENEECVLYEDTILISDIKLITERVLETTNIEDKKTQLNKLL